MARRFSVKIPESRRRPLKSLAKKDWRPILIQIKAKVVLICKKLRGTILDKSVDFLELVKNNPKKAKIAGLTILSVVIILFVVYIFFDRNTVKVVIGEPEIITFSTDEPEEAIPSGNYTWIGREIDPKYINLPTISRSGYIQHVGVDQNNQIAVPSNVFIASWFVNTVRPGQKGLSIIDGHVDGPTREGIFHRLEELQIDDTFEITLGNGTVLNYRVLEVKTVPVSEAEKHLFEQKLDVVSQLNLITCGGNYNRESRTYEGRVIVMAQLMGN